MTAKITKAIMTVRLTKRFPSFEKLAEDRRVGETVLEECVNWNIENLIDDWNLKVCVTGTRPITASQC